VMPSFYGLNIKYDWKVLCSVFFGIFVVLSMIMSIYPLLESNKETIIKESTTRASFMARQIVERNMAFLAEGATSKVDIGSIPREDGVIVAVLTDLESRILAPATNAGNHLSTGEVGIMARKAANLFMRGRETGYAGAPGDGIVVAIEPVKVLDPRIGRNVVVGMGVVALDTSLAMPDLGSIGMTYSHSFIATGLMGLFLLIVLYRLTLKRFEVLNEDLDKVLKGDMTSVTNEFMAEDLDQLWDVINSALQRLPEGGGGEVAGIGAAPSEEYINPMRMIGDLGSFGVLLCDEDKKVIYANSMFDEMTGTRASETSGQDISAVARDQAFITLTNDMFGQVQSSGSATEDFEFSGVPVRIYVSAFGAGPDKKGYALIAIKQEDGA
jgi:PAS domain-containing protein